MITNKGNEIIAKYLLGQTPEYASYLAIGVGAKPLLAAEEIPVDPTRKSLDFEAFRVPIESKGIVNDTLSATVIEFDSTTGGNAVFKLDSSIGIRSGDIVTVTFTGLIAAVTGDYEIVSVDTDGSIESTTSPGDYSWLLGDGGTGVASVVRDRLVFKAQLPPDQLYNMSEIGVYPGGNNQLAIGFDSRILLGALLTEAWTLYEGANVGINYISSALNNSNGDIVGVPDTVQFINSDNTLFTFSDRKSRYEAPRLFNRSLFIAGDLTEFTDDDMTLGGSPRYIICQNLNFNFSKNSSSDTIKVALAVLPQAVNGPSPDRFRFRMDLFDSAGNRATASTLYNATDLNTNRYKIVTNSISDFAAYPGFLWSSVVSLAIYVQTLDDADVWDGAYVLVDGIRLDNENTPNPLYGLVSWSPFKNSNDDGLPIVKIENSQGYIEYRMGVSIY